MLLEMQHEQNAQQYHTSRPQPSFHIYKAIEGLAQGSKNAVPE